MYRSAGSTAMSKTMERRLLKRLSASSVATRVRRRASRVLREHPVRLSFRIASRRSRRKSQDRFRVVSIDHRPCWYGNAEPKQVEKEVRLVRFGVIPCHRRFQRDALGLCNSVHDGGSRRPELLRVRLGRRVDPATFGKASRSVFRQFPARVAWDRRRRIRQARHSMHKRWRHNLAGALKRRRLRHLVWTAAAAVPPHTGKL